MKKILVALFFLTAISIPQASASTPVIRITDKPHISFDGEFRDNELARSLLPDGRLGKILAKSIQGGKTWLIDPALIDEILDMADGYSIEGEEDKDGELTAKNWLDLLKFSVGKNPVVALPYGNPDQSLAKIIAPSELNFYSAYGKAKLEEFLGRTVKSENGWGKGKSGLSYPLRSLYTSNRQALTGLSTISTSSEITDLRARLARVMNPALSREEQDQLSFESREAVKTVMAKLRVNAGRYQLTSDPAQLPITLINDFDTPTVVNLSLTPLNSRMQIKEIGEISLAANSRQQLTLDVKVIAPGSTIFLAQFINSKGQLVGEPSELALSATIIDSKVAWFTTGAAILLFLGAITQSVRRIRRERREK
jgi:hypothetical protein